MYYQGEFRCIHCDHAFTIHVEGDTPPEPDTLLTLHCPMDASQFQAPFSLFQPIDSCPPDVVPFSLNKLLAANRPSSRKPSNWWQFWK
jgi:hypothetical protein